MSKKQDNPIVEIYRKVKIRQHPIVFLRVSIPQMKRIIDAKEDLGLTAKEAILTANVLCKECKEPQFKKFINEQSN